MSKQITVNVKFHVLICFLVRAVRPTVPVDWSGLVSQPIARPLLSHRATLVHVVVHVVQVGQELDNNDNMGDWERFSLHKTITEL